MSSISSVEYKLLLLWFLENTIKSIDQVTRYYTAFYSNSLQTAQYLQHYIKEPLISLNILLTE